MGRATWQERLWAKAAPNDAGCLIWHARIDRHGYGMFRGPRIGGRSGMSSAHRWAYIAATGHVPDGLVVDHLCNVTVCINPDHLEAVTNAENQRRKSERQTHCKWGHEFTEENTRRSRGGRGRSCKRCERIRGLAHKLGVDRSQLAA
jgi:hypothetical protein